jgi:DNA-binding transcriptional LysR family regulator
VDHARLSAVDLNLLVVLDALLLTRSVTRAAGRLGLSQPAVSNALARLRRTLNDPILVRGPGGMVATPRALSLEQTVRTALRAIDDGLVHDARFSPTLTPRTFIVAATDYVQFLLLGPLVDALRKTAPAVRLRVVPVTQRFPWHALETGDLDLAIIGRTPDKPSGLRQRALLSDRIVCVMRRDHPAARGPLGLEEYLALDHVDALPVESPGLADIYLARVGRRRRVVATTPHFLVAPFVVAQSDCALALSARVATVLSRTVDISVRDLPFPAPEFSVHAYWHERLHDDPAHRFLRARVHEAAQLAPASS